MEGHSTRTSWCVWWIFIVLLLFTVLWNILFDRYGFQDVDLPDYEFPWQRPQSVFRPRVAILSLFVSKTLGPDAPKIDPTFYPHLLNKACYANVHGYDFIFNQTWGFTDDIRSRTESGPERCWLDQGHWHRVPKLQAMLESNRYDWVLWTDTDYVFNDLSVPLESLLYDLELHNKKNVHLIVTDDHTEWKGGPLFFSSFGVLVRNSEFGRRIIYNWMEFAKGICPKGNYPMPSCEKHQFQNHDQVGLWYAIPKTYSELHRPDMPFNITCNPDTGLRDVKGVWGAQDMQDYLLEAGLVKSANYSKIPDDQPIIFSAYEEHGRGGLALNQEIQNGLHQKVLYHIFAYHKKRNLPEHTLDANRRCREHRQCHVGYDGGENLQLGCGNESYVVFEG